MGIHVCSFSKLRGWPWTDWTRFIAAQIKGKEDLETQDWKQEDTQRPVCSLPLWLMIMVLLAPFNSSNYSFFQFLQKYMVNTLNFMPWNSTQLTDVFTLLFIFPSRSLPAMYCQCYSLDSFSFIHRWLHPADVTGVVHYDLSLCETDIQQNSLGRWGVLNCDITQSMLLDLFQLGVQKRHTWLHGISVSYSDFLQVSGCCEACDSLQSHTFFPSLFYQLT